MAGPGQLIRNHGTIRDTYDDRDLIVKVHSHHEIQPVLTTARVDLEKYVSKVYDQGEMNSCTANALCSAYSFHRYYNHDKHRTTYSDHYDMTPSRLFVYYNSRVIEKSERKDDGLISIRSSLKAFNKKGVCCESKWKYTECHLLEKPKTECYDAAKTNKGCRYERLLKHHTRRRGKQDDIHQLMACLHQKSPFIFAFDIYESFHNPSRWSDWTMPRPNPPSDKCEGAHAVMAVGYDNSYNDTGCVKVLNSWGKNFKDRGYFYMPYDIITNPKYCYDFWKVTFQV